MVGGLSDLPGVYPGHDPYFLHDVHAFYTCKLSLWVKAKWIQAYFLVSICGRQKCLLSKNTLIPGICNYVRLHGEELRLLTE